MAQARINWSNLLSRRPRGVFSPIILFISLPLFYFAAMGPLMPIHEAYSPIEAPSDQNPVLEMGFDLLVLPASLLARHSKPYERYLHRFE
ncbi:hypothetical protein GC207_02010 [bacterium]|nr:hypothetical protein [bacterium]